MPISCFVPASEICSPIKLQNTQLQHISSVFSTTVNWFDRLELGLRVLNNEDAKQCLMTCNMFIKDACVPRIYSAYSNMLFVCMIISCMECTIYVVVCM